MPKKDWTWLTHYSEPWTEDKRKRPWTPELRKRIMDGRAKSAERRAREADKARQVERRRRLRAEGRARGSYKNIPHLRPREVGWLMIIERILLLMEPGAWWTRAGICAALGLHKNYGHQITRMLQRGLVEADVPAGYAGRYVFGKRPAWRYRLTERGVEARRLALALS